MVEIFDNAKIPQVQETMEVDRNKRRTAKNVMFPADNAHTVMLIDVAVTNRPCASIA